MYLFKSAKSGKAKVQLMGSGAIFREVIAAADLLSDDFGIEANIWSVLGINQLHRDGMITEEYNLTHPDKPEKRCFVEELLHGHDGPAIISTDYVTAYGEQLRRLMPNPLTVLGTDGYGRSDTREVSAKILQGRSLSHRCCCAEGIGRPGRYKGRCRILCNKGLRD